MKAVDLFCGCGGLSLGFQNAGMEIVAAFDNWIDALTVYRNNFNHPAIRLDLSDINLSVKTIRPYNPDIIIGGPPCQDFSSAGKRNEDNGRGDLTVCYARIISEIRPQWFVMENVERILKTQKLQDALAIFHSAGYGLTYTVLNAALCGVPQKRKRFVMIGKLHANDDFIKDTLLELLADHEMSVAEYFGDKLPIKFYYRHPRSYIRRGIFSTSEPSATIRGVNRPMPKGYKLHPGDPVSSLEGIRPQTTRERSMIQTFPEDFIFNGTKTDVEQMIGNAVPVNLGQYIADAIFRYSGEIRVKHGTAPHVRPLDLFDLFNQYATMPIVENIMLHEEREGYGTRLPHIGIDTSRSCLVGLINNDNLSKDADLKVRYEVFPSNMALNNLYYFMPYIEGKGVRDIYLIKTVHIEKTDNEPGQDRQDGLCLAFEMEFIRQMYDDYKPVELSTLHSFTEIPAPYY